MVRPRFSPFVYFYLSVFFAALALLPLIALASRRTPMTPLGWTASLAWPIGIAALFLYVDKRCSDRQARYGDGLLWVAASMMTGWVYMSFITVLPALLTAFFGSVLASVYGDVRRDPTYAPARWTRLVHFFYAHRMRR